jgi:GNAT superfamily N-acetyltransferase
MVHGITRTKDEWLFESDEGHVIYTVDEDGDIYIRMVEAVVPGKGYGTALMRLFLALTPAKLVELEAYKIERGIHTIDELVAFYQKFGFEVRDRFPADDDEGERVFMALERGVA